MGRLFCVLCRVCICNGDFTVQECGGVLDISGIRYWVSFVSCSVGAVESSPCVACGSVAAERKCCGHWGGTCSMGGVLVLIRFKVVCMFMCAWGACVWVEGITLLHYLGFRNNHAIAIS